MLGFPVSPFCFTYLCPLFFIFFGALKCSLKDELKHTVKREKHSRRVPGVGGAQTTVNGLYFLVSLKLRIFKQTQLGKSTSMEKASKNHICQLLILTNVVAIYQQTFNV